MFIRMEIEGIRTLMVHNPTLVDARLPITKEYKKLTGERGKTEEILDKISELEFRAGLYLNEKGEPCLPSRNIKGALQHAGKKTSKGKDVREAVLMLEKHSNIIYDGPKTWKGLWEYKDKTADGGINPYVHIEQVKVQKNRVTRTRPIFPVDKAKNRTWGLVSYFQLDESVIDFDVMGDIADTLGARCGICECRPDFGRFEVVSFEEVTEAEVLKAIGKN